MYLRNVALLTLMLLLAAIPAVGAYSFLEVSTASKAELDIIASHLGIPAVNDQQALRRNIITHFDQAGSESPPPGSSQEIEIRSADTVVSVTEGDRSIVSFRGNVDLLIKGDNPVELQAALVILDQKNRMLYAGGMIDAEIEHLIPAQYLSADAVLFSLESWSTAVLGSTAEFTNEHGGSFFLTGDRIMLRNSDDILIEGAAISTRKEDPYFSISSSRLRLLPSGDLSLTGATLYLGRIPVMYLPYLYYPSRTFAFHPVIGFDSDRGFFSQNTLYLSGSPKPKDEEETNIFQFFLDQASREQAGEADRFSLTYKIGETGTVKGHRKILADMYSGAGDLPAEVFLGFDMLDPNFSGLEQFRLQGGLSFGRQRQFLELPLPYENFGGYFDMSFRLRKNSLNITFQMPYTTDIDFSRDFLNRFEHFSLEYLTESEIPWPDEYRVRRSLEWKFAGSYTKTNPSGSLVERLNISNISASLTWRIEDQDGNRVFRPNVLTLPSVTYSLQGRILSLETRQPDALKKVSSPPPAGLTGRISDPYIDDEFGPVDPPFMEAELRGDRSIAVSPAARFIPDSLRTTYLLTHDMSLSIPVYEDMPEEFARFSSRLNHTLTNRALIFTNSLDITSVLRTRVHYFDRPFGDTLDRDRNDSYIQQQHDFRALINPLGMTYRMNTDLYYDRFLHEDEQDRQTRKISWDADQFRNHDISYKKTFRIPAFDSSLETQLSLVLPPLDLSVSPKLTFTRNAVTLQGETRYTLEDNRGITFSSAMFRYRHDKDREFTQMLTVNHEQDTWKGDARLKLAAIGIYSDHRFLFGNEYPNNSIGPYTLDVSYGTASLKLIQDWVDSGTSYAVTSLRFRISQKFPDITFWKNRIRFTSSVSTNLTVDRLEEFNDRLELSFAFGFRIEEFLSLSFKSKSTHRNPGKYLDDPGSIFSDIFDSLNFGDISARRSSPFNIDTYQVEAVHYMPDWDLIASLNGRVERKDGSWELVHRLHVYLQWKHIPFFTFDERSEFDF